MSHTMATKVALGIIVSTLSLLTFFGAPQYSSARGNDEVTTATSTKKTKGKNVDATCMQTAVDTRETALTEAWSTFATDIEDALSARKSALYDAWGKSDVKVRNTAIATAWKTWKSDKKSAHTELRSDRKATWETFKKTAKDSCKIATPKDEVLGTDTKGELAL